MNEYDKGFRDGWNSCYEAMKRRKKKKIKK